ncbi:hypothetical protein BDW66DRAFT_112739 [Aspergillus desertorum]
MATFGNPLYSFPTSPIAESFWTSFNVNGFPAPTENDEVKMDPSWQSAIYSMPDYSCLPLDSFSGFSPTGDAIYIPQISDGQGDVASWVPPVDTFAAPVLPATSIVPLCTQTVASQCSPFLDSLTLPSSAMTPSDRSSPSDSGSSLPSPAPSAVPRPKPNRDTKTPIRCWEHSCGGRAFSSLGNYERHLREKSGRAKSFTCEQCGQRFTRSTAKNKHINNGRCRARHA